jgi:acetyl/propionyl-CoA carboxylase alpha subunit
LDFVNTTATKVLVANRGEIACRILHTLREMNIPSVAVCSEIDAGAPHTVLADETVTIGGDYSYLEFDAVIGAARSTGATAIHPGYGFLSQNAAFAEACGEAGIIFIGPSPASSRLLGDKRSSRESAQKLGIPVIPGEQEVHDVDSARSAVKEIGYPILLKAAGGGGGKGMRLVRHDKDLATSFEAAAREAKQAFADDRLLVEKYIDPARHVEVQILADGTNAMALGERECSLQRRYQKIIEESPSPGIDETTREALQKDAVRLAEAAKYASAGTVEFLVGPDNNHYFLEVNTRLQVEHPVTEWRTGIDLVRAQVEIAHGSPLPESPTFRGHAIEARLNAEDPWNNFLPASGKLLMLEWPSHPWLRIDTGIRDGQKVHPVYDPLLAKLIVWAPERETARRRLIRALREVVVLGLHTNQPFLIALLESDFFRTGKTHTTTVESATWDVPEPPDYVREAATQFMQSGVPVAGGNTDSKSPDHFSPWRTLGAFRMGQ